MDKKSKNQLAEKAVLKAVNQLITCSDYKEARLKQISKYYNLYNGNVKKKLRQLFNVAIPIFPGMIDTLNAQYDTPIQLKFQEGSADDYFKVKKINAMFQMETMNTAENSKWDTKLRLSRKDAIFSGRGILRYSATSDPKYKSTLENVPLKDFYFQPDGGIDLEKHLWVGQGGFKKTKYDLLEGVKNGKYDKVQVDKIIKTAAETDYLPEDDALTDMSTKLERFKPLGLDPSNHNFVGETVYELVEFVLHMNGVRYYIEFEPWTKTWVRFVPLTEITSSNLYPWDSWATHEDPENFLSKSYADDLYKASNAIIALFNQELTNREKQNFHVRAYDKDMFKDVKKLDEASYRPDALVPVDTKGGTRRISEGLYEFQIGGMNGTVNLIDWITQSLGKNTGANDLSMGQVTNPNVKASVTFAEQKSISKRLSWASSSFQEMMASIGKKYIWGLKDNMPARTAIKMIGQNGWDWDEITRLDLDTTKDIDVIIISSDQEVLDNEMKSKKRNEILTEISADPSLAAIANAQWRLEQKLRIGEWSDVEIATAMDSKSYADKKALAHSAEAIQMILKGLQPDLWFGATISFMQKIVDFAVDHRSTLGDKYAKLIEYATSHVNIIKSNMDRKIKEEQLLNNNMQNAQQQTPQNVQNVQNAQQPSQAQNPGIPGGVSKAMNVGNAAVQ